MNEETKTDTPKNEEIATPGGKKKKIIIAASGILLLILVVIGLFFGGFIGKSNKEDAETEIGHQESESHEAAKTGESSGHNKEGSDPALIDENQIIFYDLEEFIVNLSKIGGQSSFLKMSVSLAIKGPSNVEKVKSQLPLIRDTFLVYLRELRSDDLQGSSGIYKLREELLLRINKLLYPIKIDDILFREILVQ